MVKKEICDEYMCEEFAVYQCKKCKKYLCEDCAEDHECFDDALDEAHNKIFKQVFKVI